MNTPPHKTTPEKTPMQWTVALIWLGVFLALPLGFGVWSWFKDREPDYTCVDTWKKQQVITKLDGDVASYKTEIVYGCLFPDGRFIPRPDAQ